MENFCLNWNGFDANIRESLKTLRQDQRLFDVTLISDDGQQIQAHKIILSSGSSFFRNIFMKTNHHNMLVYLKGISSNNLEPVIDFIYNGEASIAQEQLKVFIETGKELQVKGLEGELTRIVDDTSENVINNEECKQSYENDEDENLSTGSDEKGEGDLTRIVDGTSENPIESEECKQGYIDYEHEKLSSGSDEKDDDNVETMNENNIQLRIDNEISLQINERIEKKEGVWKCKVCGKTELRNSHIRRHAERHIKEINNIHSELFSCDICGKTGMHRLVCWNHKRDHKRSKLSF